MKTAIAAILIILSPMRIYAQSEYYCQGNQNVGNCPPCNRDVAPRIPTKGGTWQGISTSQNGYVVNVYARNPPNGTMTSAIDAGEKLWGTAVDTTSQPGKTIKPPYEFDNTNDESQADIIIEFNTSTNTANYNPNTNPPTITINPNWAASMPLDVLAAVVAHEFGHDRGLADAYKQSSGCQNADTIMGDNGKYKKVEQRDVYQMNKNFNDRGQCCAATLNNPHAQVCLDQDADGVTTCDGDCDDSDPSITYDCYYYDPEPQGGGCYNRYQCYDYYECNYHEETGSYYNCRYIGSACYNAGMYCYQ